jgi:predicted lysophospholipase L1 biosynthesis ABC-type transport system permease subunit
MAAATNVVIGVVGDSKYRSLREEMLLIFYTPRERKEWGSQLYLYARTDGPPASIMNAARKALFDLEPQAPFSDVVTMHEQVTESLWQERLLAALAIIFSVVAVLMAGTGLYGLIAYDTNQRTREFGIRAAVGAQRKDVGMLVFGQLIKIIVPGIVLGLGVCLLSMRIIHSILYGVKPFDPVSLVGALLVVGMIGLIAIWQPMYRAMGVDPAIVLRDE